MDLVDDRRQLAVGADLAAGQLGDGLLVGRSDNQGARGAIGEPEHQWAILGVATALLPEGGLLHHRRAQLLGADPRELLVHDRLDAPGRGHTERQHGEASRRQGAGETCPQRKLIPDLVGLGRRLAQRPAEQGRESHSRGP